VVQRTSPEPMVVVVMNAYSPAEAPGAMAIELVDKPTTANTQTRTIQVSYARSADIAETVERIDAERAQRPSRRSFAAANTRPTLHAASLSGDLF
jgi:hypothetical protein